MKRPTWFEGILLGAVLTLGALYVLDRAGSRDGTARAEGGGAANNVVVLTGTDQEADKLYLVDTALKRILVYKSVGDKLRLVGARGYEYDVEIVDSSGDRNIENSNGATYGYVKSQVEEARRRMMEGAVRP